MAKKKSSKKGSARKSGAKKGKRAPKAKGQAKEKAKPQETREVPGASLLDQFSETLLAAGAKAEQMGRWSFDRLERYGKLGIARAELERERFALHGEFQALGEAAAGAWEKAPRTALAPDHPAVAEALKAVRARLARIREIEAQMATIRTSEGQ